MAWNAVRFISVVWVLWLTATYGSWFVENWISLEALGQTGDAFGSINALFTGLALVGLAYTVYEQRLEFKQARNNAKQESRQSYLAARLTAEAAILESCMHGVGLVFGDFDSDEYIRLLKKNREALARQRIGFLRQESLVHPRYPRTKGFRKHTVACYLIEMLLVEVNTHKRMGIVYHNRREKHGDAAAGQEYIEYASSMSLNLLDELTLLTMHSSSACQELYDETIDIAQQLHIAIMSHTGLPSAFLEHDHSDHSTASPPASCRAESDSASVNPVGVASVATDLPPGDASPDGNSPESDDVGTENSDSIDIKKLTADIESHFFKLLLALKKYILSQTEVNAGD